MTHLYRVFDAADQLLYVGIAEDVERRIADHERYSGWFDLAERLLVTRYSDRASAASAERAAIVDDGPIWNRQGSPNRSAAEQLVAASVGSRTTIPTPDELKALFEKFDERLERRFRLLGAMEYTHRPLPQGRLDRPAQTG